MLNCILVELFKGNPILPPLLYLRNLVCCLLSYILGIHSIRHFHYLKRVWLHKYCVSVATYLLSCQLLTSHYTMWSCLKVSSRKDLHTLTQLESQHLTWNANSSSVSKSIFSKESSSLKFVCDFFSRLFSIEC